MRSSNSPRARLTWTFSYICCIFVYRPDLDSVPLFVGMRRRCIKYLAKVIIWTNLVSRVCHLPALPERERRESRDQPVSPLSLAPGGREDDRPWERGCHWICFNIFFWILVWALSGPSKIAKPAVFQVALRGIGKSFQSAITAPLMNLTGYGNATAQSWRFNTGIKFYSKTSFSSIWDVNISIQLLTSAHAYDHFLSCLLRRMVIVLWRFYHAVISSVKVFLQRVGKYSL